MQARGHIRMHHGKTQVWNRGGVVPDGIEELTAAARLVKPEAVVWRGSNGFLGCATHKRHGSSS